MANRAVWAGWMYFTGVMLLVLGAFNLIEGIVALINDQRVVVVADRLYLVDLTSWGWTQLILGLLLGAVGFGILRGMTWARITAIVVVSLHAIVQVLWIGAYPIWSLLMVALDTVVLFGLTARWSEAKEGLDAGEATPQHRSGDATAGYHTPVP